MNHLKLRLRTNTWYAVGTLRGKPIKKSSGYKKEDREQAEEWILRYELELRKNPNAIRSIDNKPFKVLLNLYRDSTTDISHKELNALDICERYLGQIKICDVRTDLSRYIKTRHNKSKDNSIDRDVRRIKAIINFGKSQGLCGEFMYYFSCEDDTRNVYAEADVRDKICAALPEKYRDFYIVLNFQGLRFGQAQRITGEDIQGDYLETWTKKGQKRRNRNGARTELKPVRKLLGIHPRVMGILVARVKVTFGRELLFPEINYQTYRLAHIKACKSVGVTGYRIHDNRKTFATLLSHQTGATDRETAQALGQSTTRNVYKYSVNRDLKVIISKLI